MFQKKVVEKIENKNTHCMFSNFFSPENLAVCEIVWKNMVEPDRLQTMYYGACWITKDTDTHSEYVLLIIFARQRCLRERPSVLRLYVPLPVLLTILKDCYKHSSCKT